MCRTGIPLFFILVILQLSFIANVTHAMSLLSRSRNPTQLTYRNEEDTSNNLDESDDWQEYKDTPQAKALVKSVMNRVLMPYLKNDEHTSVKQDISQVTKETDNTCNAIEDTSKICLPNNKTMTNVSLPNIRRDLFGGLSKLIPSGLIKTTTTSFFQYKLSFTDYKWQFGSCYKCGSLYSLVPADNECHTMFSSNDARNRAKRFRHRVKCYRNRYYYTETYSKNKSASYYGPIVFGKNWSGYAGSAKLLGWYHLNGCVKRFLDVGTVFTQRNCRVWPPDPYPSLATHRFNKLELMMFRKRNECMFSPYASLTPFARGISLYVRYHVCVCNTNYCNHATTAHAAPLLLLAILFIYMNMLIKILL